MFYWNGRWYFFYLTVHRQTVPRGISPHYTVYTCSVDFSSWKENMEEFIVHISNKLNSIDAL